MKSVWQETALPGFGKQEGDLHTDVLIIGGGITGILTAWLLQEAGVDYVLAERKRILSGNTGRTTAKITAQHGLVYQRIAKEHGLEAAALYWKANTEALEEYARLCKTIDCGFARKDSYVYSLGDRGKLEAELRVLEKIGAPADLREDLPLPLKTVGAVRMANQAQFDPVRFLGVLAKDLHILEHTQVTGFSGKTAMTDRGRIHAERIVCATHFPFVDKHGSYFLKMYQERSYVLGLESAQDVDGMYVDEKSGGLSFRNAGDLLLLGGGGGRPGKKQEQWDALRQFTKAHYPGASETHAWAAQDCISLDGIPYIGRYSARTPELFAATGFNKWGMTSAMAAARLLRDLLLGKENEYARLFSPSRTILRKQLWSNCGESVKGFLTVTPRLCPHLGCGLHWNEAEHSWDCPCHGSRFDEKGKLLDGPSNSHLI